MCSLAIMTAPSHRSRAVRLPRSFSPARNTNNQPPRSSDDSPSTSSFHSAPSQTNIPTVQDLVKEWCDDAFPAQALNVFLAVLMSPLSPSTCASATSASSRRLPARAVHFAALGPHQTVVYLDLLFQMAVLRYSTSGLLKHNDHPPISVIITLSRTRICTQHATHLLLPAKTEISGPEQNGDETNTTIGHCQLVADGGCFRW